MLKKRVIPKLLLKNKRIGIKDRNVIVTTQNFKGESIVGDPISQAKVFESAAADELLFLDIDANRENRCVSFELVENLASELLMPFTVGGGVSCLEDFRVLLRSGADKICVNSSVLANPPLISEAANVFGRQCVVVSIDYRNGPGGHSTVYGKSGMLDYNMSPLEWAVKCQELGAGEVILTCIDRDGTRSGLDLKVLQEVSAALSIPVIASGGCGSTRHFIEGFVQGGVSAVSAGTFFAFKDENPFQTRAQIRNAGVAIR